MSTAIDSIDTLASRRYVFPTDIVAEAGASKILTAPTPFHPAPPVTLTRPDSVTLTHGVSGGAVAASLVPGYSLPAAVQEVHASPEVVAPASEATVEPTSPTPRTQVAAKG